MIWKILFPLFIIMYWACEEEPKDCAGVSGGDNICGCTDSLAINFDNTATYGDESCEYDTTPPSITITFIAEGSVSEMVSISCISTDNESIEKVELWINGVATSITDTTEPYSLEWNTTLYENDLGGIMNCRKHPDMEHLPARTQDVKQFIIGPVHLPLKYYRYY